MNRHSSYSYRHWQSSQCGQVLMEFVIALAILTVLGVLGASQWSQKIRQLKVEAMAEWLLDLRRAVSAHDRGDSVREVAAGVAGYTGEVSGLVETLKQRSRLPSGFSQRPPMDYQVVRLSLQAGRCVETNCLNTMLLVAIPNRTLEGSQAYQDALDLLLALGGHGGAVPLNRPGSVVGARMTYENLQWAGQRLPVGSVVLDTSEMVTLLPYVRLREDRSVRLQGSVGFGATVSFDQMAHMHAGLVIGKTVSLGDGCHTQNQIAFVGGAALAKCQSGRWTMLGPERRFRQCDDVRWSESNPYQQGLILMSHLGDAMQSREVVKCFCAGGFLARYLGKGVPEFQGVRVVGGFLCESL